MAGERSEAWQEVFLNWFPQTVKKVSKKRGEKTKNKVGYKSWNLKKEILRRKNKLRPIFIIDLNFQACPFLLKQY